MNIVRVLFMACFSASFACAASADSGYPTSRKKGAAGQVKDVVSALARSGATWNYNWQPLPGASLPAGVEFVPMIWNKRDIPALDKVAGQAQVLLGFNEPDREKQANMSVEDALDLWPKLEATKLRLGSPAPAGGATRPGGWLDRFMTGAKERGYRVDFVCLHWYGENYNPDAAVKSLQAYLTAAHERYQRPIWLTEFAISKHAGGPPATVEEQQAFMAKALPMLETLPFVERYSWFVFGMNKKAKTQNWYLLGMDGSLSELGQTYATASPASVVDDK